MPEHPADDALAGDRDDPGTEGGADDVAAIVAEKRRIRALVRARRTAMTEAQRDAARTGLTEQLDMLVTARGARRVSCYLPIGTEPDTRPFLACVQERGVEVLLPSAREDGLLDWILDTGEGTVTGAFGIPEPLGDPLSPLAANDVDLMLIPGCAVDEQGVRLGWGRGYFDRNLGSMDRRPPAFVVLYDTELFPSLPSELHDVPVTGAVTPERIVHFER